ncbi:MAG TPA: ABC transporter substrate-binding protein [Longimicrobiaceae bacterium]|nr:ABC transporter substrate-binding protein [Longimicrobiaceae bacterium]
MKAPSAVSPRKRVRRIAIPLLLLLVACDGADGRQAQETQTERVVSVSKQLNEFLYAIGAEDGLVARDLSSVYPPAIQELPSVGYHRALSAEGILSMRPTLLLTDGHDGPQGVLDQVRSVGVPVLVLEPGSTVESAQEMLARLGERFGREEAADSVLTEWKAGMKGVRAGSAGCSDGSRPRVLLMHFGRLINNYLAVTRGGAADRMIRWAGGENAVDSIGGMRRITPELIARAAPDVIIATDFGFDRLGSAEEFRTVPGVGLTPAGQNGRIYRIEETEIIYFGPRTPGTVAKLRKMICGTAPAT